MTLSPRLLAVFAMLGAVMIYGTNFAISRHATLNGLSPNDLVALRFLTAGPLLLPISLMRGRGMADCAGVGWRRGLILTVMSGFPMSMVMLGGLAYAPASHGASIAPGTVTVIGAVGAWLMFGERLRAAQIAGLGIVLVGLGLIGWSGASGSGDVWKGDLLFLCTGLIWGGYPLLVQKWKVDALAATAVISVLSLSFLPLYAAFLSPGLANVPWQVSLFHAINQGVLNVIVGLWLWGYAVRTIGAGPSGRFPPLIPVIGTLTAIPLNGEIPGPMQIAGIVLIVGGLLWVALQRR